MKVEPTYFSNRFIETEIDSYGRISNVGLFYFKHISMNQSFCVPGFDQPRVDPTKAEVGEKFRFKLKVLCDVIIHKINKKVYYHCLLARDRVHDVRIRPMSSEIE